MGLLCGKLPIKIRDPMGLRHPVGEDKLTKHSERLGVKKDALQYVCMKLWVSFRKRATNHRALLRKMTYKNRASYGSSRVA